MVTIIDDEYNGNVFGRLGKGIGKGLSEQLPKEIERNRLSAGLRKFEQESKGLTPVQQFTRLAGIPGFTAEHLYTLAPLLKDQSIREEGDKIRNAGGGNPPPSQDASMPFAQSAKPPSQDQYSEQKNVALDNPSLKSIEATKSQLTPIVRKSDEELMPRASELAAGNIHTYPRGAIDALPRAREEENTRIANLEEQRRVGDVADAIEERVREGLSTQWGKDATVTQGATDSNIPGTIQSKLQRKLVKDLANPKNTLSEQQLITKYAEIGKDIAKAKTILDSRAASSLKSGDYSPSKIGTTIDETRKAYKKAEGLEEFQDIIANKFNLSAPGSSAFAFPPENPNINTIFKKMPKPIQGEMGAFYPGKDPTTLAVEAADKISPYITDNDSLLTYAVEAKKNGLNDSAFLNRLKQNRDAGIFSTNERQAREISKGIPFWPAMGDIWTGMKNIFKGKP
jgi:hypothetical protein